ncbi:restriction endonuclease [Aliarcobacter skirrowii]|uniref:restriction endonuclease n=1 Tax=Aliarcobacter skirrowii TaxID=28200 RepID=UPI002A35D683|nr:restriction endonuclease [Aliarcobacter skirrowii]MDY0179804.1 restriction endonuclease [Aliarcobacter skirrowii]
MMEWLASLSIKQIIIIVAVILILVIPKRILLGIIGFIILVSTIYINIDFSKYINMYQSEIIMFSIILIFVLLYVKVKSIRYEIKLKNEKSKFEIERDKYKLKIEDLEQSLLLSKKELIKQQTIIDDEKISLKNQIKELEKNLPKVYSKEEIENMKKFGDDFEIEVGKYFENAGFDVEYRGLELGVLDGGIDLIAKKDKTIFLIQCKYWKKKDSITHNMIKEFYGNCNFYIDKHNLDRNHIVCIYVIANVNSLHFQAYNIFKENYQKCRFLLLGEEKNTSLKELL